MDADGDALAVGLLAGDALDVDDVLEAVDAGDLSLTAFVGTADDGDLVVFANGYRANLIRKYFRTMPALCFNQYVGCS